MTSGRGALALPLAVRAAHDAHTPSTTSQTTRVRALIRLIRSAPLSLATTAVPAYTLGARLPSPTARNAQMHRASELRLPEPIAAAKLSPLAQPAAQIDQRY
jgi:hypothetical protein